VTGLQGRFWRLYASSATSNLADGIGRTALPLVAASCTRDPVLVAGLTTFAFLPWLLFALVSGALVDRGDRRYAMSAANALRAVASGTLVVLTVLHAGSVPALYAVAFLLGTAETVYDSATRALLPQVVGRRDLDRANGLLTVEETLGQQFIGSPVGSALFAVAVALPLGLNAAGFAAAAVLVLTVPGDYRPARSERTSVRRDMADGVRWLSRHALLRGLTLVSAATALVQSMGTGVLVLYVLEVLRLPAGAFGLIVLGTGVGGLVGGVLAPSLTRRVGRAGMLTGGAVVAALAEGGLALTTSAVVATVLGAVSAAGVMVWNVLTMSLRQSLIPEAVFGRVQGAYRTLVWGGIALGSVAGGAVAHVIGLRALFGVIGAGLLVLAAVLGALLRRHADELADEQPAPVPA
jgi:Na+/melibiose symporter-like transporter